VLSLVLGLGFVLVFRLLLPDRPTDFDPLYNAAAHLIRGENPYLLRRIGSPIRCRPCFLPSHSRRFRWR
jgi:hypothetical protein